MFLQCKTSVNPWNMFLCILGYAKDHLRVSSLLEGDWEMRKRVGLVGTNIACIWWTLWKERNLSWFEDNSDNILKIKMNGLSLLYFLCKKDMAGDIELLVD